MTLAFVEFREDVPAAVDAVRNGGSVVALTPETFQALDDRGVSPQVVGSPAQQTRDDAVGYEVLERFRPVTDAVDAAVEAIPAAREVPGFSLAHCWGQQWLVFLNALGQRADALEQCLAAHAPSRVMYFAQEGLPLDRLVWGVGESVWTSVFDAAQNVVPLDWTRAISRADPDRVRARIRAAGGRVRLGSAVASMARVVHSASDRIAGLTKAPGGRRLLVLGHGRELHAVADALRNVELVRWSTPPPFEPLRIADSDLRRAAGALRPLLSTAGVLRWGSIDMEPAVWPRIEAWLGRWLPGTAGQFAASVAALRTVNPEALLHGETGPDAGARATLEAAGALGIPRRLMQWGGNYGYVRQPYLTAAELRTDTMLTYTDAVASELAEAAASAAGVVPETRSVGSSYFAHLREGALANDADQIVYVPSALTGNYRYGPHLCLDDVALYGLERRVVEALATAFPNRVVVKLHPANRLGLDPLPAWIRSRRLPVRVTAEPLESVWPHAAVWVIDGLATVFQQAAVSGRPVVYLETGCILITTAAADAVQGALRAVDAWSDPLQATLCAAVSSALSDGQSRGASRFVERYVGIDRADSVKDRLTRALDGLGACPPAARA